MLHTCTKFRGNRNTGSGEVYGPDGHLGHVAKISHTNVQCHYPRTLRIKFQLDQPSGLREDL